MKRLGLVMVFVATLAIGFAYATSFLPGGAPAWAAWPFAVGTATIMVAMMIVGAARRGRVGRLGWALGAVLAVVGGGFALLLALPATEAPGAPLVLGLPLRAAVLLYGIGVLPMLIVPFAYAFTFDRLTLSPADLERVREAGRRRRAHAAAQASPGPDAPPDRA
jgi:hypothetical protein